MSAYPDYPAEMALPPGKTCADCVHVRWCVRVQCCTTPERTSCDFHPNKFRERTMNVAEKLAREISRVTALRCRYEELRGDAWEDAEPAIAMIAAAIEAGLKAAGVDDAITQMKAIKELEGFTE